METPDAPKRTERSPVPDRPRHADGPDVPAGPGSPPCSPRSCPRTSARRCGSSCSASACWPGATRKGNYALTDEFCAHRGVSLWFGRNEHNGLRCPYHGWKYDHTGQCIEVPSEPSESGYCSKIMWRTFNAEVGTSDLC